MNPGTPIVTKPDSAASHSLVVFLIGVCLPLYVFGWLAKAVSARGSLSWDAPMLALIHKHDSPGLDKLLAVVGNNGDFRVIIFFTLVCAVLLLLKHRKREERFLAHCIVGAAGLIFLVKALSHRAALLPSRLPPWVDLGSPSAHSMGAFALAFGLATLAWPTRWRWLTILLGAVNAGLVAVSRVYLGVHQASDILAAWSLGLAWGILMSLIHAASWQQLRPSRKCTLLAAGAFASLVAVLAGGISSSLMDRYFSHANVL